MKMWFVLIFMILIFCTLCKDKKDIITRFEKGLIIKTMYINDTLSTEYYYDSSTNNYKGFQVISKNDYLLKYLELKPNGDTLAVFDGMVEKGYNSDNNIFSWYRLMPMSKTIVGIDFDSTGKLKYCFGSLSFLTKQDTQYINKHYPDWQEQIKAREAKEKVQVNP